MTSDASHLQFSEQIWRTVTEHAQQCLYSKEFNPEHSRVDNLRCVFFDAETDENYGRQFWFFEALGPDPWGNVHHYYGALEYSLQYGLLENCQAALFEEAEHRLRALSAATEPVSTRVRSHPTTGIWVRLVILAVIVVVAGWLLILAGILAP
jgi:hypothetical protein